jgi:hypothetical protein
MFGARAVKTHWKESDMIEGRIVTAGLMFAIFTSAVGIALIYFPEGARMLPLVVGIPGVILSAIQLVSELRRKESKPISPEMRAGEIKMIIWFFSFASTIILLGFTYGSPVMIAAYLHLAAKEKWYTVLIGAALAWSVLEFVFTRGIGIVLYEGIIPPMFVVY